MNNLIPQGRLAQTLSRIKLIIFDVDGVLTDGKLIYGHKGEEFKAFNARDGVGIKMLLESNVQIAIISGRDSLALRLRAKELGITLLYEGVENKVNALDQIKKITDIKTEEIMHVGDDLPDLKVFDAVGLGVSVSDAHPVVKQKADLVATTRGGEGIASEICMLVLKAQNKWPFD